jgi:hypothetical protein
MVELSRAIWFPWHAPKTEAWVQVFLGISWASPRLQPGRGETQIFPDLPAGSLVNGLR